VVAAAWAPGGFLGISGDLDPSVQSGGALSLRHRAPTDRLP